MYRFIETFLQVQFTAQWSRWVKMQRRTLFHEFRGQTTSVSLLTLCLYYPSLEHGIYVINATNIIKFAYQIC